MKFLLFSILIFCAVKCDDISNNYYVIEMPEDELIRDYKKPFRVYWNVPTIQCKSKNIVFNNLYEKYGIIQNDDDNFRGEKITIMYEPGSFPAIFKNETSGKYRFRNGGVPQEGDLEEHLKAFREDMEEIVPDPDFSGIGIIDFESWRPIFRQNFGTLVPYKDVSYEIEKKLHWWWPKTWIHTEATQRFETAARTFMQTTLSIAKQMRPKAIWGYYGFPHCFNMAGQNMKENCSPNVVAENDLTHWMWSESTALYPSVYSSRNLTSNQLGSLVRGRVNEANRVRRYETPVLPYYWFSYREGGYMKEEDLNVVLKSFYKSNASGFIIWGSSSDVNSLNKCKKLYSYVETVLGPAIAKYIKKINIANDVIIETPPGINIDNETFTTTDIDITNKTIVTDTPENNTSTVKKGVVDPEFDWIPPENYTQDISQNVEEELVKKGYNKIDDRTEIKTLNDSVVVDMIFDALIKADNNNTREDNKQTTREIQFETGFSIVNNSFEVTEAPIIKDLDALNSLITKDPLGFIEKLAIEEAKNDFLDDTIDINEYKKDKKESNGGTESIVNNILTLKENEKPSYSTPVADISLSKDVTDNLKNHQKIDTTTLKNDIIKQDHKIEENIVKITNDNFFMDIFDALLNANFNLEGENDEEYIKSVENVITNPTIDTEYTTTNLTNNVESNIVDITRHSEFLTNNNDYTETTKNNEESDKFNVEGETTEINLSSATENNQNITSFTTEDISSEEQIDSNEELDDFLIKMANTTDFDFETATQYDEDMTFDNNEDNLIILAVNLSSINKNQSNSDISNTNEYTTEDSNTSTLGDSVTVTESAENEFITKKDPESLNEDINESFTTDAVSDQVSLSSSFAMGSKSNSIYLYIYSTFIFFNNIFIKNTP